MWSRLVKVRRVVHLIQPWWCLSFWWKPQWPFTKQSVTALIPISLYSVGFHTLLPLDFKAGTQNFPLIEFSLKRMKKSFSAIMKLYFLNFWTWKMIDISSDLWSQVDWPRCFQFPPSAKMCWCSYKSCHIFSKLGVNLDLFLQILWIKFWFSQALPNYALTNLTVSM